MRTFEYCDDLLKLNILRRFSDVEVDHPIRSRERKNSHSRKSNARATHTCLLEASPKVTLYYRLWYNDLKEPLYN